MTTGVVACANPILQCLSAAERPMSMGPNVDGTILPSVGGRTFLRCSKRGAINRTRHIMSSARAAAVNQRVMIRPRFRRPSRPQFAAALNRRRHKFHCARRAAQLCDQIGLSAFGALLQPDLAGLTSLRYFYIRRNMKFIDGIESLAAQARESRLAILRLLAKRGPEGCTPTRLGEKLWVSSPTQADVPLPPTSPSCRLPVGVSHLGFQVDTADELREVHTQLTAAGARLIQEDEQACCYTRSDKLGVASP